jgi:hypothetical protein
MTKVIQLAKPFVLRPYSKKELRTIMGISKHVLNTWLKVIQDELGPPIAGLYSPKQIQIIIDHYGVPGQVLKDAA